MKLEACCINGLVMSMKVVVSIVYVTCMSES